MTDLTPKQRWILELLSEGLMEKQIAVECGITLDTVKWHTKRIRRELGARNQTHMVAIYVRAKKRAGVLV